VEEREREIELPIGEERVERRERGGVSQALFLGPLFLRERFIMILLLHL
jgi:hypothetical protein